MPWRTIVDWLYYLYSAWIYYCTGRIKKKKYPPVPIAEFAHHVNELKANKNLEFQKEYDVSVKQKTFYK